MRAAIALLALIALALPGRQAPAQEFGRLFHTPEQRAALDARRKAPPPPERPIAPAPERSTRVDGYVQRSAGRSTVWLDGEPVTEGKAADDVRAHVRDDHPGRVSLSVSKSAKNVQIGVGATFDHASGVTRDLIGEGEIRFRR